MYRFFENTLLDWKESGMKKPLMVVGARQIGKTFIIEEFGKNNFEEYLYFNLEYGPYLLWILFIANFFNSLKSL